MKHVASISIVLCLTTAIAAQTNFDASTARWRPIINEAAGHGGTVSSGVFTADPSNTTLPAAYKAYWGVGNYNFNLYFHIKADQAIGGDDSPKITIVVTDQDQNVCHESGYLNGLVKGVKDGRYIGTQINGYANIFSASWEFLSDPTVPYEDNIHSSTLFGEGQKLEFRLNGGAYSEAYCILRKSSPMTGQLESYRDASYTDLIDVIQSENIYQRNIGRNSISSVEAWRDWCDKVTQTWSAGFVEVLFSGAGCKATIDQMWGEIVDPAPTITGKSEQWFEEISLTRGYAEYDSVNGSWALYPEQFAWGFNYIHPFPVGYNCFEISYTMRRDEYGLFPGSVVCATSLDPEEQKGQPLLSEHGTGFGDAPGQAAWVGTQYQGSKFNFYGRMYEEPDNPYSPHPRPFRGEFPAKLSNLDLDAVYVLLKRVTPNFFTLGVYRDPDHTDPIGELAYHLIGRDEVKPFTPYGLSRMSQEVFQSVWYLHGDGSYYNINKIVIPSDYQNLPYVSDEMRDHVQQRYGEYMDQLYFKTLMVTFDAHGNCNGGFLEDLVVREIAPGGDTYQEWSGPTNVATTNKMQRVNDFRLYQNHPNPFNPITTIEYYLPETEWITIEIFNLLGEKIGTLANSVQKAGAHRVAWNGRDDSGRQLPSGIYLYRLQSKSFAKTMKMILAK